MKFRLITDITFEAENLAAAFEALSALMLYSRDEVLGTEDEVPKVEFLGVIDLQPVVQTKFYIVED